MGSREPANPVVDKLRRGGECVGSFVFSPDPAHTEIIGKAGLDYVMIDLEHAYLDASDVVSHVRAAHAVGISPLVRVRHNDAADVGRLLDAGVQGIMFPHLGLHPGETTAALQALRYAPGGSRPTCSGVKAVGYGVDSFAEYADSSNRDVLAIGLIEDQEVVDRVDEVLDEYPVDVVIPGSGDLATSLGLHGQHEHPLVVASLERVIEAVAARPNVKTGMYLVEPRSAERWRELGVDFFLMSIDYRVLSRAYAAAVEELRGAPAHA